MASIEANADSDYLFHLSNGIGVRQWRESDAASMAHHVNNKKIWDMLRNGLPHPYTLEDAQNWISPKDPQSHMARSGPWTLATGAEGPLIRRDHAVTVDDVAVGSIALVFKEDIYVRSAELGYWLGEEFWGRGIMSDVAPAYVEWAWKTFGILIRLDGLVVESNGASRRVLEKAGFVFEGVRRNAVLKNGVVMNEVCLAALRPE